jgi:hypothetical protein
VIISASLCGNRELLLGLATKMSALVCNNAAMLDQLPTLIHNGSCEGRWLVSPVRNGRV